MDVILSLSFKMTTEIEIRKHKLMFCVLLRTTSRRSCVGFVSHMFFHCHEMRLHCSLSSVAWFQLALISSDCFESFFNRLSMVRSFAGGSSMKKALNLRLFTKSCDHPQWRSGYVWSGQPERARFKFCYWPSFSLLPFLFCFVCLFVLLFLLLLFCF